MNRTLLLCSLVPTLSFVACKENVSPQGGSASALTVPSSLPISASPSTTARSDSPASPRPPYTDLEGRFEIAMPSAPKVERRAGALGSRQVELSADGGDAKYYLLQLEFPQETPVNVIGAFAGAEADICKQDKLKVTTERDYTLFGDPARDVVASSESDSPWKDTLRFVYAKPYMYSVFVRGVTDEAKARAYLDSFRLLDDAAALPTGWVKGKLGPGEALFPFTPKEATSKQAGPDGPMDVRTLRVTRGPLEMGIQLVVDPKPGPEAKLDINTRLDAVRDTFRKGFGQPHVVLDKHMTVTGLPASHLKLILTDHRGTVEMKIAFPQPDTLVIGMATLAETATGDDVADAAQFMDSFELTSPL